MTVLSTETVPLMQALAGPFTSGDTVIAGGYHASADGGGGAFAVDLTVISSATLSTDSIVDATNTTPIVIEATGHPFVDGQAVRIASVGGNTAANGDWIISDVDTDHFTLVGSSGNGTSSGGTASSVTITASAAHGLVSGQRVIIERNSDPDINDTFRPVGVASSTVFSIPCADTPGTDGTFGDGGRTIPSTAFDGRWVRIDQTLSPRYYGARCDNVTDDSADFQAMLDANPGGHYVLPGSVGSPVTIFLGTTTLRMKGAAWILEGGGSWNKGATYGGTTLRWSADTTGIVVLNNPGGGTIRQLQLLGGDTFLAAEGAAVWLDAILPDFTDATGTNIFTCALETIGREDDLVKATVRMDLHPGGHTYVPGTQIRIAGVTGGSSMTSMNGLYYITAITRDAFGLASGFSYASIELDVWPAVPPTGATSSIANTGTSTADAIVAGANYLRLEDINIQSWGRFGIHAATPLTDTPPPPHWADGITVRNVSILNCRGIGLYIRGYNANVGDYSQITVFGTLAGGIYDTGAFGNTHIAEHVTYCGGDYGSIGGSTHAITDLACASNVVTVTCVDHGFKVGQAVVLSGLADSDYEAPADSAVFVAEVVDDDTFNYHFTAANATPGAGGTARLATGTELLTAAGIGAALDGTKGSGFSYWIGGSIHTRVVVNPYAEEANGPIKFGGATLVLGGILGVGSAPGFAWFAHETSYGSSLATYVDGNFHRGLPDRGTRLQLRGGGFTEQTNEIFFLGSDRNNPARWYMQDDPTYANPAFILARSDYPGRPRLVCYAGPATYPILSAVRLDDVVTITTNGNHGIAFANQVLIVGAGTFDGLWAATFGLTQNEFKFDQVDADETLSPVGATATRLTYDYDGQTHLSGEGTGSVALNFSGGTGGVRICNGAGADVAKFDSGGQIALYRSLATVSRGVVAEHAEANVTGQTASITTTALYPVPSGEEGLYRVTYYLKVTTAATTSSSVTVAIGWTDKDDSTALTTTSATPANSVGDTGILVGSCVVDAAATSNITYATTYASSGATAMVYKLTLRVEAM